MDISSFLRLGSSATEEGENEYITFEAIKKHFENYTEDAQNFGQSILDLYKNGDDFESSASVSNRIERTTQFYSYISNYNNGPRFLYIDFDIYFIELISGSGKSYSNIKIYFPTSTTLCLKISFTNTDYKGSFKSIGTFKSAEIESIMPGKRHLFSSDYFPTDVATIDEIKEYIDSLSNDNRYYNIVQPIVDLYENYGITELYSTGTKLNSNGDDYPGAKDIIFFIDVSNDYEDQGGGTIFYNNYLCLTIYDPKEPNRVLKTKFVKENDSDFELGKMSYEIVEYSTDVPGKRYMLDLSELVSLNNGSTINDIEELYNLLLANTAEAETLILSAIDAFKKEGVYSFVADGLGEEMSKEQHYTFYADLDFDESWASGSKTMKVTSLYFYNPYNRNEKIRLYYTDGYMDSGTVHVEYVKKPTSRKYISSGISGAGDTLSDIKTYFENKTSSAKSFKDEIIKQFENFGETGFYYSNSKNFNSASNLSYKLFYIDLSVYAYNDKSDYVYDIINITIYDNKNPNEKLVLKFRGFVTKGSITHTDATFNSAAIIELSKIGQEKYDTVTLTADHQGTGILPPSISKGYRAVYEYYNSTDSEITFYVSREDGTVSDISVTVASGESVFLQFIKGYNDKLYVNRLYLDSLS